MLQIERFPIPHQPWAERGAEVHVAGEQRQQRTWPRHHPPVFGTWIWNNIMMLFKKN